MKKIIGLSLAVAYTALFSTAVSAKGNNRVIPFETAYLNDSRTTGTGTTNTGFSSGTTNTGFSSGTTNTGTTNTGTTNTGTTNMGYSTGTTDTGYMQGTPNTGYPSGTRNSYFPSGQGQSETGYYNQMNTGIGIQGTIPLSGNMSGGNENGYNSQKVNTDVYLLQEGDDLWIIMGNIKAKLNVLIYTDPKSVDSGSEYGVQNNSGQNNSYQNNSKQSNSRQNDKNSLSIPIY